MLVIEKKKDIAIYRSMGAEVPFLRNVFLTEGVFITLSGACAGLIIGMIICYLQESYGLIQLGGSGSCLIYYKKGKFAPPGLLSCEDGAARFSFRVRYGWLYWISGRVVSCETADKE
jgi:ABC-type antimicrobial peptide transport system permease subunit